MIIINKYALLYAANIVKIRQVINENNKNIMQVCRGNKLFVERNDVNYFFLINFMQEVLINIFS